ncbi:MAG: hypothetical protein UY09_C0003G0011 [Parcubacteria group bacterium GW2011_GWA2_47_8]|nr:MAG: hypothetical protein UY09_C0003G0011 [Parcubacteria group bacterium GW2011_GWA2_47_8]OHB18436.1 MAG: hypothetical protein A2666_05115 [Parcubacteria group bacterium RIFCSPHIGHO2_01_FULL_47_10b]
MKKKLLQSHLRLQVILYPEPEGGFTVLVPSLPGCVTYGKNFEKALQMAREAAELYLEDVASEKEFIGLEQLPAYMGEIEIATPQKTYA